MFGNVKCSGNEGEAAAVEKKGLSGRHPTALHSCSLPTPTDKSFDGKYTRISSNSISIWHIHSCAVCRCCGGPHFLASCEQPNSFCTQRIHSISLWHYWQWWHYRNIRNVGWYYQTSLHLFVLLSVQKEIIFQSCTNMACVFSPTQMTYSFLSLSLDDLSPVCNFLQITFQKWLKVLEWHKNVISWIRTKHRYRFWVTGQKRKCNVILI